MSNIGNVMGILEDFPRYLFLVACMQLGILLSVGWSISRLVNQSVGWSLGYFWDRPVGPRAQGSQFGCWAHHLYWLLARLARSHLAVYLAFNFFLSRYLDYILFLVDS